MLVGDTEGEADAARPARLGWRGVTPGLLLVAIAAAALSAGHALPGRSGDKLGPGTFPFIVSATLLCLGLVIGAGGFLQRRVAGSGSLLPAVAVVAAVVAFMLTIGKLGLAVASGLTMVIVAGYALRARPIALVLVVVGGIAVVIAAAAFLGLSQSLWPFGGS
jgi:putative tricarboxylic transport membrane protein